MTSAALVRVTVISDCRRADLAVPGAVPVAELVPVLARALGGLAPERGADGLRLLTHDGRLLAPGEGLLGQGVGDGGLLTMVAEVDCDALHDDLVDAVTEVVRRDVATWDRGLVAVVCPWAAVLALLAGAGLLALSPSRVGVVCAAAAAVVLTAAATAGSRLATRASVALTVGVGLTGCAYAAVAGGLMAARAPAGPPRLAGAGAGLLVAGLVVVAGLGEGRVFALPPIVVGSVMAAAGVMSRATPLPDDVALSVVLLVAVVGGDLLPSTALACAGVGRERRVGATRDELVVAPVDMAQLTADLRLAADLLVAMAASLAALVTVAAPFAVARGPAGVALAVLGSALLALRTRHHVSRAMVVVGVVSGALGLVSTVWWAWWLHPGWRTVLGPSVTLAGACGLLATAQSAWGAGPARLVRALESVAVVALAPALVLAAGLVPAVRR